MFSNLRKTLSIVSFPLAALTLTGCVAGVRYTPPENGPKAELTVTSNRVVTNQWIRLHKNGCDFKTSELVGALNNKTVGWDATGDTLSSAISADQYATIGVMGIVSDAIRNESGNVTGTKYSHCYPMATFYAKRDYRYFLEQRSEINEDTAHCGFVIFAISPGSSTKEKVDFKIDACENLKY